MSNEESNATHDKNPFIKVFGLGTSAAEANTENQSSGGSTFTGPPKGDPNSGQRTQVSKINLHKKAFVHLFWPYPVMLEQEIGGTDSDDSKQYFDKLTEHKSGGSDLLVRASNAMQVE